MVQPAPGQTRQWFNMHPFVDVHRFSQIPIDFHEIPLIFMVDHGIVVRCSLMFMDVDGCSSMLIDCERARAEAGEGWCGGSAHIPQVETKNGRGWERARATAGHRNFATGSAKGVDMLLFLLNGCTNECSRGRQKNPELDRRIAARKSEKNILSLHQNRVHTLAGVLACMLDWAGLADVAGWLGWSWGWSWGWGQGCWAAGYSGSDCWSIERISDLKIVPVYFRKSLLSLRSMF